MNKQQKYKETMTVFFISEERIEEFEVPTKPYNMYEEPRSQSNLSSLETIEK